MRITYANYLDAERKAQQNLTAKHSGSDTNTRGGSQHTDKGKQGKVALASVHPTLPFDGDPPSPRAPAIEPNGS
jgi:hypothetical protein